MAGRSSARRSCWTGSTQRRGPLVPDPGRARPDALLVLDMQDIHLLRWGRREIAEGWSDDDAGNAAAAFASGDPPPATTMMRRLADGVVRYNPTSSHPPALPPLRRVRKMPARGGVGGGGRVTRSCARWHRSTGWTLVLVCSLVEGFGCSRRGGHAEVEIWCTPPSSARSATKTIAAGRGLEGGTMEGEEDRRCCRRRRCRRRRRHCRHRHRCHRRRRCHRCRRRHCPCCCRCRCRRCRAASSRPSGTGGILRPPPLRIRRCRHRYCRH